MRAFNSLKHYASMFNFTLKPLFIIKTLWLQRKDLHLFILYIKITEQYFLKWFMLKGLSLCYNWDAYKRAHKRFRYSVSQKELQEVKLLLVGRQREGLQDRKNWLVTRRIHGNNMKIKCRTTGNAVFWHIGPHNMHFALKKNV